MVVYKNIFETLLLNLSNVYPEVELLVYIAFYFQFFEELQHFFP